MTYYFAQNATVEVREPGTARFKVVGAAQEVSIDTEFEVEELYQFGSILRTTAARHHASINVKVSTAQFGAFADDAAWFWKVINAAGPEAIGGTYSTDQKKITISDTTNLPMFSIAGEWTSDDGTETIYGRVDGVYFKNFSWGGALGEYIIEELEGTGSQVTFTNNKAYAAGGDENIWAGVPSRVSTSVESIYAPNGASAESPTFEISAYDQYTKITAISSDTSIATVNTNPKLTEGVVTVTNVGGDGTVEVYIVADGLSKTVPVEFWGSQSVTLSATTLSVVKDATGTVSITAPTTLTGIGVTSSDTSIATVTQTSGTITVTGVAAGTCTITVTNPKFNKATIAVTVTEE